MKEKIALLIMKESYMQWQHLSVKGELHAEETSSGCR
jgi:hypothetical protein